jgi:transglutaminase-like putative cysteine protease
MKFRVFSDIEYQVLLPSTFIFNIHALRTTAQTVLEETLIIDPYLRIEEFSSNESFNRFARLEAPEKMNFKISYTAMVDTYCRIIDYDQLEAVPVVQLDGNVIPYLFPSRYCQSDKLRRLAYDIFGEIKNVYSQVLAISDWIYNNVEYISGTTDSTTSAYDTVTERTGVCRDFAHLGIALCRALSIPARYFTGYAYQLNPPDFHACFEAYIGTQWIIFDATKSVPLNGLVKIANGKDAADAAVASTFGRVKNLSMNVGCNLSPDENFFPFFYDQSRRQGLSYDPK